MAIIKFSGLVTDIVGKLNGSVLQGSEYGTVLRNNCYGKSAKSIASFKSRSSFASSANFSSNLSPAYKSDWVTQMALLTRPTKQGPATPYNWYNGMMAFNGKLKSIGLPPNARWLVGNPMEDMGSITAILEAGTGPNYEIDSTLAGSGLFNIVIRISPAVRKNTAYKSSIMRIVSFAQVNSGTSWSIPDPAVVALFGYNDLTAPRWFDIQLVDPINGVFSTRLIAKIN